MSANSSIQEAIIKVDVQTLGGSLHGSVTGVVRIWIAGVLFPEKQWSDFPIIILSWWLKPVPQIQLGAARDWEWLFMDGPYSIQLRQHRGDDWILEALQAECVVLTAKVSCRAVIRSLLDAAALVLRDCNDRGWQGGEISELDLAVQRTIRHKNVSDC